MPKRTNLFQRIVVALYKAVAPLGGTVTESATLYERLGANGKPLPREVDILAETSAYGHPIRLAVEIRGRSRRDDVRWIDELIGKYRDLGTIAGAKTVNKIVAVSATGFSVGARDKASASGIELLTAGQLDSHNWPADFIRIGVAKLTRHDQSVVGARTEPSLTHPPTGDTCVRLPGDQACSYGDLIGDVASSHKERISSLVAANSAEYFPTLGSVVGKLLVTENTITVPDPIWLEPQNGERVRILELTIRTLSSFEVVPVAVTHTQFALSSGSLVSSASLPLADGITEVVTVQTANNPNSLHLSWQPAPQSEAPPSKKRPSKKRPSKKAS